jgi:Uma2 family endonuclease
MGVEKKYQLPPRTGMEVFMMLPEGTLAELINDTIYMSPTPNYQHQEISAELSMQIRSFVKKNNLGSCLAAIDVFFDAKNVFEPDILFISRANMNIVKGGRIKGSPDFIIEILSPGNRKHDTETKKTAYEKFGVGEYYIVDPDTKMTTAWYLVNKKFTRQPSLKGKIKSRLLKKTFSF